MSVFAASGVQAVLAPPPCAGPARATAATTASNRSAIRRFLYRGRPDCSIAAVCSQRSVLPATVVAALALAGCDGDKATLATFAGTWQGHGRGLTITRGGFAKESIYFGADFVLAMEFRLSRPRGTPRAATATATVTALRIGDRRVFTTANPAPHVGESRTIRLREGVITETLSGANYCSPRAKHWVCGA